MSASGLTLRPAFPAWRFGYPGVRPMEFLVDILDDRLEAIEADDDRERLRRYLDLWRAGAVASLGDPGVVVVATLDAGRRPRRVVANDGEAGRGTARGGTH